MNLKAKVTRHPRLPPGAEPAPFIVGAARSGTTLLRLMLDSHPLMAIPPETHFLTEVFSGAGESPDEPERVLGALTSHARWADFGIAEKALERRLRDSAPLTQGAAIRAFYELYAERHGKPRWGDKTPTYVFTMREIEDLLPEARFIHVVRDGRDVVVSLRRVWFGPKDIDEIAEWWASRVVAARRQGEQLHCYMELRYEDLVQEPAAVLEHVCEFLELDWDPAMLRYPERAADRLREEAHELRWDGDRRIGADERLGIHDAVREPPSTERIGRWRSILSEEERVRFERIAGPVLRRLGYETAKPSPARATRA